MLDGLASESGRDLVEKEENELNSYNSSCICDIPLTAGTAVTRKVDGCGPRESSSKVKCDKIWS